MEHSAEIEISLPNVSVQLVTVNWDGVEATPAYAGYSLSQRLSDNHAPVRIGTSSTTEALPRVRSVGLLPPGRSIEMFPLGKPLRVLHCSFEESFFESSTGTTREQWEQHIGLHYSIKSQRLEILMQELHAELLQPEFGHERLIEATTTMILIELARYLRKLERRNSKHGSSLALAPWQLRRIQERIEAALESGYPSVAELAAICGISQGHLARSFKAATGWQIHKYIGEERLKTSKTMLAQAELSCEEVSARLGFKSPAYFSTTFRRMTGKTPSEYRSEVRSMSIIRP